MRNQGKKGFTLIELLIVIAIIGILAAVLIPNLLRARQVAQDRAGTAYARSVLTSANAYLAENVTVATVATNCATGYDAGGGTYLVNAWGPVTACTVTADGQSVSVTYTGGVVSPNTITLP